MEADNLPKENPLDTALSIIQEQIAQLNLQQDSICGYLEKGVYTIEMFTKRNAEAEIIPTTQKILDSYPHLSVAEKNSLWKIVMEKITIYRTLDGEFSMNIYPKLHMTVKN